MFTMKGCSLIRGVHYERFHCTAFLLYLIAHYVIEPGAMQTSVAECKTAMIGNTNGGGVS